MAGSARRPLPHPAPKKAPPPHVVAKVAVKRVAHPVITFRGHAPPVAHKGHAGPRAAQEIQRQAAVRRAREAAQKKLALAKAKKAAELRKAAAARVAHARAAQQKAKRAAAAKAKHDQIVAARARRVASLQHLAQTKKTAEVVRQLAAAKTELAADQAKLEQLSQQASDAHGAAQQTTEQAAAAVGQANQATLHANTAGEAIHTESSGGDEADDLQEESNDSGPAYAKTMHERESAEESEPQEDDEPEQEPEPADDASDGEPEESPPADMTPDVDGVEAILGDGISGVVMLGVACAAALGLGWVIGRARSNA